MLKFLVAFLLFFLMSTLTKAANGCVDNVNTNILYTTTTGNGSYNKNTFMTLSAGCSWQYTSNPVTSCNINGNVQPGYLANTSEACPIDDYVLLMVSLLGSFGCFVIRKSNIIIA